MKVVRSEKLKKIFFALFIILITVMIHKSVDSNLQKIARSQNNFNLDSVIDCLEFELAEHTRTEENLKLTLNSCAKKQRSIGITGDMFVLRKSDKMLFWDASVHTETYPLYLTEDGVCSLFSDSKSCINGVNYMINNPLDGEFSWKLDDSVEYVNYEYMSEPIEDETYIVAQGAQKDELHQYFKLTHWLIVISATLVIIISTL